MRLFPNNGLYQDGGIASAETRELKGVGHMAAQLHE